MNLSSKRPTLSASSATLAVRARVYSATLLLVSIAIVACALRLYRLDAQSLWLDEGGTWAEVTRNGWLWLGADLFRPTAAYPLYHLLLKGWVALAGDSEWALRLPSALAGTGMVVALMAATSQIAMHPKPQPNTARPRIGMLIAGLLAAMSPYALWHAQDAKVYSFLMFVIALLLWAAIRAVRMRTHWAWSILGMLALSSLFVHRLALLPVAALALALAWILRREPQKRASVASKLVPAGLAVAGVGAAALGVIGLARSITSNGWQESGHSAAAPLESLWLNLSHFMLDRGDINGYAGLPLLFWALPALTLTAWGTTLLIRDSIRGIAPAILVLNMFALPLLLFALTLAFTPVYEARYAAVAFPAWILVLSYPFCVSANQRSRQQRHLFSAGMLAAAIITVNIVVLRQPEHGLFSGAVVKEDWRTAINKFAEQVHPDDLVVLHPYYTLPLWEYYAPRVTPDPLLQPKLFSNFAEGDCAVTHQGNPDNISECFRRRYDDPFNAAAKGKKRALLLIAPEHAATIDRPPTPDDRFGWVGLRFQYAQNTWPCGGDRFVGVEIMCQSYPETYNAEEAGQAPDPAIPLEATFGGEIKLRGYSLDLLGGEARSGGALPITLYWEAVTKPSRNYSMFLHLCQDCEQPPLAGVDGAPLRGYPDAGLTSTWIIGDPVHDERSMSLPENLAPGRYTLILGVRPADEDPMDLSLRLTIANTQAETLGTTRLILGTIEITK